MERTKLVSLRMERDVENAIAQLCKEYCYFNRSAIVNKLLNATLFCCEGNGLWEILSSYDPVGDGVMIIVKTKKI